jgi:hypothetical protein
MSLEWGQTVLGAVIWHHDRTLISEARVFACLVLPTGKKR